MHCFKGKKNEVKDRAKKELAKLHSKGLEKVTSGEGTPDDSLEGRTGAWGGVGATPAPSPRRCHQQRRNVSPRGPGLRSGRLARHCRAPPRETKRLRPQRGRHQAARGPLAGSRGQWPGLSATLLLGALLSPSDRPPSPPFPSLSGLSLRSQPSRQSECPSVCRGAQPPATGLDGRAEAARVSRGLASEVGPALCLRRSVTWGGGSGEGDLGLRLGRAQGSAVWAGCTGTFVGAQR